MQRIKEDRYILQLELSQDLTEVLWETDGPDQLERYGCKVGAYVLEANLVEQRDAPIVHLVLLLLEL